tara:strand:- start:100 stop:1995 length:1896 start_codon:yes stop_codon:yes gene_type:complete
MAYKFQLGPAILSGSIRAEDGLVATDVDDTTAANVVAQIDAGEIPIAKLAAKTISGKDLGSNLDALSVDDSSIEFSAGSAFNGSAASAIRIKASGVTDAMLAGSISNGKLSNSTISGKALGSNLDALSVASQKGLSMSSFNGSAAVSDLQVVLDAAGGLEFNGASGIRLEAAVAGAGLAHSSGVLSVGVDDSGIEINSDALRLKDNGVTLAKMAGITRGSFIVGDASGDPSALALGSATQFLVSDGDDLVYRAMSGDATMAADGQVTIAANAVQTGMVHDDVAAELAGAGLTAASGVMAVGVDASSIEINADALRVKASGITNAMLSGSIASSKIAELSAFDTADLSEGSNLYHTTARARGAVSATDAGGDGSFSYNSSTGVMTYTGPSASEVRAHLTIADTNSMDMSYSSGQISADLRLGSADALEVDGDGLDLKPTIAGNRTFSGNIIISGDLQVDGTNTILNTTSLEVEDKNIYMAKGNADSAGADGAGLTIEMGSDDLTFAWNHAGDQMQIKKGASFANLRANKFIGDFEGSVAQVINAIADADGSLAVGFNYGSADTTAARTWTLPASPEVGQVVHVKAPSAVNSQGIKIQKAGSQTIDGAEYITLESPYAAVNLMYVASNTWRVY